MPDLLLIVRLGGRRIAFPAHDVEAVVELDSITPAPQAASHVAGLAALRSRVLTVIDPLRAMGVGRSRDSGPFEAIVVPSGGHPYALLVDSVEDVTEPAGPPMAVRAPVGAGWDEAARGVVEAGGDLLLLVDPHALIAGPALAAA